MARTRNSAFLEFAYGMALAAGKAIRPHFRAALQVADKGGARGYDPVTVADRAAEEVIRARIERAYPDHGIRGEELGWRKGTSRYTWVIDPIDGTRSFILGQMHWATLIALHDGRRVVVGVAHQPYVGESFLAEAGAAAEWRRGRERRRLRTRRCRSLDEAVLACTDPTMFRNDRDRAAFRRVAERVRLTRWGGDCYALLPARDGADRRGDRIVAARLRHPGAHSHRRIRGGQRSRRGTAARARRAAPSSRAGIDDLHRKVLKRLAGPDR